jgi:release factor glutamine methyltransferase
VFNNGNIGFLLKVSEKFLNFNGLPESKLDSEILLSFILQIKRFELYFVRNFNLTNEQISRFEKYIIRRSNREPLVYIMESSGFMGFEFKVNRNVFIPRFETELLVDTVLKIAKTNKNNNAVLDLCTGSGCIAISLAKLGNFKNITASDINNNVLEIAKKNVKINNVSNINFIKSDIFSNMHDDKFDIIVSNPPYVSKFEYSFLDYELRYEPKLALLAQDNGLFFYKEIKNKALKHLNKNGSLLLELNANKSNIIKNMFMADDNYKNIEILNDYSGLPRILKVNVK